MRFTMLLWAVIEVLQLGLIASLLVGYRRLQRRLEEGYRFSQSPPRSITEEDV